MSSRDQHIAKEVRLIERKPKKRAQQARCCADQGC
jgi:hypothetical protein